MSSKAARLAELYCGRAEVIYVDNVPRFDKLRRSIWGVVQRTLYRMSPTPLHAWRRFLLRSFGARIDGTALPYPNARIWAPWNLTMERWSCLADDSDCYTVAPIMLEQYAIVSQYAHLCSATHDFRSPAFELMARPIRIGEYAWVAAGAFVGPGVTVGDGAVVGARACVVKDVKPWTVVAGNPAREIGTREMTKEQRQWASAS